MNDQAVAFGNALYRKFADVNALRTSVLTGLAIALLLGGFANHFKRKSCEELRKVSERKIEQC